MKCKVAWIRYDGNGWHYTYHQTLQEARKHAIAGDISGLWIPKYIVGGNGHTYYWKKQ